MLLASVCVMLLIVAHHLLLSAELRWKTSWLREDIQRLAEQHARDVAASRSDLHTNR